MQVGSRSLTSDPAAFPFHVRTVGHLWHPAGNQRQEQEQELPPALVPPRDSVTFPLCLNRLLSVSLYAGKRVFYAVMLPFARACPARLMRQSARLKGGTRAVEGWRQVQFIVLPSQGAFNCPTRGDKSGCMRY